MTELEKDRLKFKFALFLFMVIFAMACIIGCKSPLMVYNHMLPDTIIVYHNAVFDVESVPYKYK